MKIEYPSWEHATSYIFESEKDGCKESLVEEGFSCVTEYLSPYYFAFQEFESPFMELTSYTKFGGECIVSLWNHNEALFEFYCEDNRQRLECVSALLTLAKNLICCEIDLRNLIEKSREDD